MRTALLLIAALPLFGQGLPFGPVFSTTASGSARGISYAPNGGGGATSATAALPSGTAAGDMALLFCATAFGAPPFGSISPGTWTKQGQATGTNWNMGAYTYTLTAPDIVTGSVTCNSSGGYYMQAALITFAGTPTVREYVFNQSGSPASSPQTFTTGAGTLSTDAAYYACTIRSSETSPTGTIASGTLQGTPTPNAASFLIVNGQSPTAGGSTVSCSWSSAGGFGGWSGIGVVIEAPFVSH